MVNKPEFYALPDVLAALDGLKSPETFALDIATGALPVGAILRDVLCVPEHKAKEMPGLVFRAAWLPLFLPPRCAGTAWQEGEARLARQERTPRILGDDGHAECYLEEPVAFPDPPLVNRADLVVFRYQLAPYMYHAGHAKQPPKGDVKRRTDDSGQRTVCGEVYSILERSALGTPVKGSQRWSWSIHFGPPSAEPASQPRAREAVLSGALNASSSEHDGNLVPASRPATRIAWLKARLVERGIPLPMPRQRGGPTGLKAEMRAEALEKPGLFTTSTFDHAWKALPKVDE